MLGPRASSGTSSRSRIGHSAGLRRISSRMRVPEHSDDSLAHGPAVETGQTSQGAGIPSITTPKWARPSSYPPVIRTRHWIGPERRRT